MFANDVRPYLTYAHEQSRSVRHQAGRQKLLESGKDLLRDELQASQPIFVALALRALTWFGAGVWSYLVRTK